MSNELSKYDSYIPDCLFPTDNQMEIPTLRLDVQPQLVEIPFLCFGEQKRTKVVRFRVGYEIKTTRNGHHVEDICDTLAGKYPKDFVFTGWHPQCLCYCIPILKTEDEFWADDSEDSTESINEIKDVPDGFKDWVKDNANRIEAAEKRRTTPYFIADNKEYVNEALSQADAKETSDTNTIVINPHYGAAMKLGRKAAKEAASIVENIGAPTLTEIQKENILELARQLGVPKKNIKAMNFLDANSGASNPFKDESNCQTCVVAFSARRRGIDCFAGAYEKDTSEIMKRLGDNFAEAWLNPKTKKPLQPTVLRGGTDDIIITKLRKQLSQPGEYVLGLNSKNCDGHVVNVINEGGRIVIHDEQVSNAANRFSTLEAIITDMEYIELIRVDKAILNVNLVRHILHIP